jgi:hypothetical protein
MRAKLEPAQGRRDHRGMRHLVIGSVFLVGCVVGGVGASLVSAPVARAGTTPQRWEYWCFQDTGRGPEPTLPQLNQAGQQGWELVSAMTHNDVYGVYCMKRAI